MGKLLILKSRKAGAKAPACRRQNQAEGGSSGGAESREVSLAAGAGNDKDRSWPRPSPASNTAASRPTGVLCWWGTSPERSAASRGAACSIGPASTLSWSSACGASSEWATLPTWSWDH